MNAINIEDVKEELKIPDQIKIFDTTLRDGEQAPGIALTVDEKIKIAQKLDELGVDTIEMGFPTVSEGERKAAKRMVELGFKSNICGLARVLKKDIDAVIDSDLSYAHLFIGTSPLHRDYKLKKSKEEILNQAIEAVEYAKDHGLTVEFSAEDATRTDIEFLKRIYGKAQECGADRVHIADTTGAITPQGIKYLVEELVKDIDIDIAVHLHNDFGLAVINSITGVLAGAKAVSTTVNGIGERAGNASLEELIMAMRILYGKDYGFKTKYIKELSDLVSRASGLPIPYNKPVVGNNVFRHESGIHVDAVIEEPLCYEPYLPELVGQKRQLVLGKHSGCRAVRAKLNECELDVSDEELIEIVRQVKKSREEGKYINDDVFKDIVRSIDENIVDF